MLSIGTQELLPTSIPTVPPTSIPLPLPASCSNLFDSPHSSPQLQMVLIFRLFTYTIPSILESYTLFHEISLLYTPLIHQGTQVYHTPLKAEVLAQHFERSHYLTLNMGIPHHSTTITRFEERFFRNFTPHTSPLHFTNIYEVKRKIFSLKLRSAPGNDGITPLMLRHLSRKTLTHLTNLFNHLPRLGHFPTR